SFLTPYENERVTLAKGVECYDCLAKELFPLHAYQIFAEGDILAIEKLLGIKGHNAFTPCRDCLIHGHRNVSGGQTIYYTALRGPLIPDQPAPPLEWTRDTLVLRSADHFKNALQKINSATTKKYQKELQRHYGIRHSPVLTRVNSLDPSKTYPWDWMHLFAENIIQTLVTLWTSDFKGLDTGSGNYRISSRDWEAIGLETLEAMKLIPSAFVRALGNIAQDKSTYTAESWAFWFMYIAPSTLANRFEDNKYYTHAMDLIAIMKITLQYEITRAEVEDLREKCWRWVQQYE
ncbi:hypothetical protein K474DRAFT_1583312, partial [Panus rudis PR-1116 ss-1]